MKKPATVEKSRRLLDAGELKTFVKEFIKRRGVFLRAVEKHGSPLYLIEEEVLRERAERFRAAFRAFLPDPRIYYAVKSNNHPAVTRIFAEMGLGLDVSSGKELELALKTGAEEIVFSGPGKTDAELELAVRNRGRVTVLIDSFGELDRLDRAASRAGAAVRAGVRLTTDERALWAKFGIPLDRLPAFFARAERSERVDLRGLQFHSSWNLRPAAQTAFIRRLGKTLAKLPRKFRSQIEFVDIGGGFWPERGEWLHRPDGRPLALRTGGAEAVPHYHRPAAPIDEFAVRIGVAVLRYLLPLLSCRICVEPGRWLVHDALHLLLTVVDKKRPDLVVTDAGTNAVGWERFETDYFPVINLSRPAATERPCLVLGSLCTPRDVWGYHYHGKGIGPGDLLLIPTQGAYTYSLRQEFIKPLPVSAVLKPSGAVIRA